jgi:hypothetical protein
MSKHSSRASRWTQVSAKEYRSAFGTVRYAAGAWIGTVVYQLWRDDVQPPWQAETAPAGRFKRPRNAMIAVEDKAKELQRRHGEDAKVALGE